MSEFPKTVYKITDCGHEPSFREHKYVFLGSLPQKIHVILNKIHQPEDVMQLSMSDYLEMNAISVHWEYKLGIYCYGQYTGILHSSQMLHESKCKAMLKAHGITSYNVFQRLQKKGGLTAQQVNCARRMYKKDLESEMAQYTAKNIHFVELQVRADDSILAVKNKYFACAEHADYYMRPEWVHLFTTDNTMLGLSFTDREEANRSVVTSVNPLHELSKIYKGSHDQKVFGKFRQKLIARTVDLDCTLQDSPRVPHLEIQAVDLPSLLRTLAGRRPQILRNVDDLKRAYIFRYFVIPDSNLIYRLLDTPGLALLTESKVNRDAVQKYLLAENQSFTLLNSASNLGDPRQTFQSKEHVILCTLEVPSVYKDEVIDLHKIYDFLTATDNILLISYRGPRRNRSDKLQTIVHKVRRIPAVMDNLKQLENWLDPNDESRKANTLTIKLQVVDANDCQVTLVLHPNASYKIIVSWSYDQDASLNHLQLVVEHVKAFLTNMMASVPYQVDRTSSISMPLPDPHFLTSVTPTVHFKNINLAFSLDNVAPFDYQKAKMLSECFFPFITPIGDEVNIAKYWKRNPKSQMILGKLRAQGLLDLTKLAKLTSGEWAKLDLTGNPKHNMKLRDDFRKYVTRVTSNLIMFYYKRHSHFDTINIQRRFIADYLVLHKLQIHDILMDHDRARDLILEIKRRFNLSLQDAQDSIRELAEDFQHGVIAKISSGIKCEVRYVSPNSCKVTVTGLKQYTPNSSVKQLLYNITHFFQQMWVMYGSSSQLETGAAYAAGAWHLHPSGAPTLKKQAVCSVPHESTIGVDIDDFPDSTNEPDFEDDTDDMDFDFDLELPDTQTSNLDSEDQDNNKLETALDTMSSYSKQGLAAKGDYRLLNLQQADPELYQQKGSQSSYAQKCQKNHMRQPIVLSSEDYSRLNKKAFKTPAGSPDGFEYRGKFYICPEIWCRSMRTALTPEEVQNAVWSKTDLSDRGEPVPKIIAGTCPDGEPALIANDGIQGWRASGISQQNPDQGRYQYPGFLKNLHPQGLGVPCCFVNDQSTGDTTSSKYYRQSMSRQFADQPLGKPLMKTSDSNRKYILDATKFPIEASRFGRLPSQLDVKLNRNSTEHSRDKIFGDTYKQYLRLGVDQSQSPILAAIWTAYNCVAEQPKDSLSAFRRHIAGHVDSQLLSSLKNGALNLLFENFPGDDSLANYQDYIVNSSAVDVQLLWDLVSRPHPWLFSSGINLLVLNIDRKLQLQLLCPQAELASSLYNKSRPALVMLTDGSAFEIVTLVRGDLSCSPLLSKPTNFAGLDAIIQRCSFITEGPLSPATLRIQLEHAEPGLRPVAQVLTAYNKVIFLLTASGMPVPTELLGPLSDLKVNDGIVKLEWPKHHKLWTKLSKLFDGALEPIHAMPDESGKVVALRLSNGMQIPTVGKVPFTTNMNDVYTSIDHKIFVGDQAEDTRVKEASRIRFLTETLERYRSELSNFLLADLRSKHSQSKYWFQVHNIIYGETLKGEPLPMWAKRSLLYKIFLTADNPIATRIVTTKKAIPHQYKPDYTRPVCASLKTPSSCNAEQHCSFAGPCQLFIPEQYLSRFTLLIIDEMLWYTQRRDAMLSNNTQADPPRTNTIRITDSCVEFDNKLALFVLKLLETKSFRRTKQDMMLDILITEGSTNSELVKQHVVYNQVFQEKQTDAMMRAVKLEPLDPHLVPQWKGCYMVVSQDTNTPLQVIAVMVSYLTGNANYTEARLRQDFAKMLRELQHNTRPYWKHYLQQAGQVRPELQYVKTLTQLVSTLLSGYPGSLMDLDLLTRVFPVQVDVLDMQKRKIRTITNQTTSDKMRVVLKGDAFRMCGCKTDSYSPVKFVFS